ncbi:MULTISPECIES: hypothetical protein [Moorena]|uniref:hypothetical protein n=1 Tax=Moorena TaxID=1155738 RepID=UPI000314DCE5|nr:MULTISPECIES: hypothetical protein [Moorena]NEP35371.1 hypothetical protein [Moorena sp. SIO3B2]NEP64617.1 hypothetical protein [Moorena sp. SIO3A5]NER87718.1 hypothetical protein [Moorena sp. SIO3A2]
MSTQVNPIVRRNGSVSIQHSAVSRQPSALWHRLWPWPLATLREWPRCANDAGR